MKKIEETSEVDIFGLVETAFQEQSLFGDAQENEITVFYGFPDLAVKGFDVLLEKLMTSRVELACLDGAHESSN